MIEMRKIILTGASDGLEKEIAKLCINNVINIIALCRNKPEYECLRVKIKNTK